MRDETTNRLAELVAEHIDRGSRLVATIMQAPASSNGSGILRGVVVHAIPEPQPGTHRTPYPVPVAAAHDTFQEGVQLVAFALNAHATGDYPGTHTMAEHETVRDYVSILPYQYVQRQKDIRDAVGHAARAISARLEDEAVNA